MFEKVKEIILEVLNIPTDKITLETNLKDDLKVDSVDLLELIVEFEDVFGVEVSNDDVKGIVTVGDIVAYLEARN
ncbi:MAG: acyl carrier protein [Clostridia bacterium]|nr:acyl carrier protein [Clostridia bacterium]